MGFFDKKEAETIEVAGHALVCPVCSGVLFWRREAQLNTAVASFFNLDWANKSATCFVCAECSHISWFLGS